MYSAQSQYSQTYYSQCQSGSTVALVMTSLCQVLQCRKNIWLQSHSMQHKPVLVLQCRNKYFWLLYPFCTLFSTQSQTLNLSLVFINFSVLSHTAWASNMQKEFLHDHPGFKTSCTNAQRAPQRVTDGTKRNNAWFFLFLSLLLWD